MASNSFGEIFRITTFGESHGRCIGVVIDGCPSGILLNKEDINQQLAFRSPGKSPYTSPRLEEDKAEIVSGVFEGKTTGSPIMILIQNMDADRGSYEEIKDLYRPGHANFTYLKKYGVFDYRGGGRASARETAGRVAAGAVAKKLLERFDIKCLAFIDEIGGIQAQDREINKEKILASPIFCPCEKASSLICERIEQAKEDGDSLGGVVKGFAEVPAGLGDPVYRKIDALLAFAMLSIPASKGFEIGEGFASARMRGSAHNDPFNITDGGVHPASNHAGGLLGGITTGEPLYFRVAFKPTSSIKKAQQTVSIQGERETMQLSQKARHDPCIAIRAVPVVEAMTAIVLADALLMDRGRFVK